MKDSTLTCLCSLGKTPSLPVVQGYRGWEPLYYRNPQPPGHVNGGPLRTHAQLDLCKQWLAHTAQHVQVWPGKRGEPGRVSSKLVPHIHTHTVRLGWVAGWRVHTHAQLYLHEQRADTYAHAAQLAQLVARHSYKTSCAHAAGLLLTRPTLPPARTPSHKLGTTPVLLSNTLIFANQHRVLYTGKWEQDKVVNRFSLGSASETSELNLSHPKNITRPTMPTQKQEKYVEETICYNSECQKPQRVLGDKPISIESVVNWNGLVINNR